ncbi:MAG: flagellar protein [Lachnospiraceae bacterium]|nr:flagellar protein [Lachnospiraceae bacterium]
MEVRNCRICGNLFNYVMGAQHCPLCKANLDKVFEQVKEFLYENKGATIAQVCQNIDVSKRQIEQWVREERLTFATAEGSGVTCKRCAKPIMSGTYCESCKTRVIGNLNSAYKTPNVVVKETPNYASRAKMRFLENQNKGDK